MKSMDELSFNRNFRCDLDWHGRHHLRLGTILPENRGQISRGLRDLSHDSIRNRFMGSKKEFSDKELEYLTNFDGRNHYAIGLEERERPHRGVAIARLVRSSSDPHEAEIAVTIIDEYQRLGLGNLLMKLITLAAAERDITRLSFTFLPNNEPIVRLIHRLGPTYKASKSDWDCEHLLMDIKNLDLAAIKKEVRELVPGIHITSSAAPSMD
jgi:acetyltransferase